MQRTRLLQKVCLRLPQISQRAVCHAVNSVHYATSHTTMTPVAASHAVYSNSNAAYTTAATAGRAKRAPSKSSVSSANKPVVRVEDLWTQIETYYENHGLLNYEQCLRLLELLETAAPFNTEWLHFLLGACVPELLPAQSAKERLQLFNRLWLQLRQRRELTLPHYQTKLQMLRQNRLPLLDHRALLSEISIFNGAPDATLYSELLDVAGANGDMRQATELLAEMRQHNFALTERNFLALLLGHARNGDLTGAESVLASMQAAGVASSANTLTLRIIGYIENAHPAKARELLASHAGSFSPPQLLQLLGSVLRTQNIDEELMEQLLRQLPRDFVCGADMPAALQSLCIELVHNGQLQTMTRLVALLPPPSFNENQNVDSFGELLLHELFRARVPLAETLNFANGLRQRGQNTRAVHMVTELALRRQPGEALSCFAALKEAGEPLRPHYFWPVLLHQLRRDGESGVLRILSDMQRLNIECDDETLRHYVLPNLWQTLQEPLEGLKQLSTCGVRVSHVFAQVLTQQLQQQLLDSALQLLQAYPTRMELSLLLQPLSAVAVRSRATKRYQQFAQLVQALQARALKPKEDFVGALLLQMCAPQARLRQEPEALKQFVHEMARLNLQLSGSAADALLSLAKQAQATVETVNALSKSLQKMRAEQLTLAPELLPQGGAGNTSFIKHPRDMSLDELECHLIELETKQLNTRGVLRRLLQLSVREGRLERALEIKAKCDQLRVQVSAGMLAAIFDLHIKLKDAERAQQSLQLLHSSYPGFLIDEHKLIDYAALLVQGEQLELAKQLLQQRAAKHKVIGGDYVLKNVWQLLSNVAQLSANRAGTGTTATDTAELPRNLTHETYEFLRRLNYCQAHNALLGPIIREWLLRGDIDAAVAEFQRLSKQHKCTPLQFELLSLLVSLSNANADQLARFPGCTAAAAQQHLVTVTATVSRVHGAPNMNSALLLALAESGTETQLRRLVINPEFRINHEMLLKNCEHLGQEGSVRTLLRLARGVRGLQRTIDEQRIYDMLLQQFARANNYEAALDLYERLDGDDELKVSQEFLRSLVKLLQLNNVEVPSNIALRAQVL